jgi:hypothetical protein
MRLFRSLLHRRTAFSARRAALDARVADAAAGAETARQEARKSRDRQDTVRERVVVPLQRAAERNSFADMIRASLTEAHRGNGS